VYVLFIYNNTYFTLKNQDQIFNNTQGSFSRRTQRSIYFLCVLCDHCENP